jgi:hypothetical protein
MMAISLLEAHPLERLRFYEYEYVRVIETKNQFGNAIYVRLLQQTEKTSNEIDGYYITDTEDYCGGCRCIRHSFDTLEMSCSDIAMRDAVNAFDALWCRKPLC